MPKPPPTNLDEAVEILFKRLKPLDLKMINKPATKPFMFHHTAGRGIRNEWQLWEEDSELVKWFRENLKVVHADDISSIILEALFARVRDEEYDPTP
jgi:hypothetical protein